MSLQVTIPDELAERLQARAATVGTAAEILVIDAIRRQIAADEAGEELLAPVREAFAHSGLTEDEAVDLFESEKHAMRSERRKS